MRIALVAACILVLQAMTGGLVTGSMASSIERDAFGNPICVTSIDHAGGAGQQDGRHVASECCTMGCVSATGLALPPPTAPVPLFTAARDDSPDWSRRLVSPRQLDHDPGSPRAPPRLA